MTRREVITKAIAKQLTWVQASEILGVGARHMRRLRRQLECWGMSAVMDQRGGRPRRKRIKAGTIELLCRLKRRLCRFLAAPFLRTRHREARREGLLQLAAPDAAGSRDGAEGTRARPVSAPARAAADGGHASASGRLHPPVDCRAANARPGGGARFFSQEGTASTFAALESVVRNHGRFCELYTDRGSHFCQSGPAGEMAEEQDGQVSQALRALGIQQILAPFTAGSWPQRARLRHYPGAAAAGTQASRHH
jgi:hypothetical protein